MYKGVFDARVMVWFTDSGLRLCRKVGLIAKQKFGNYAYFPAPAVLVGPYLCFIGIDYF